MNGAFSAEAIRAASCTGRGTAALAFWSGILKAERSDICGRCLSKVLIDKQDKQDKLVSDKTPGASCQFGSAP